MNKKAANSLLFKEYFLACRLKSPRIGYFPLYPDNRKAFSKNEVLQVIAKEMAKEVRKLNPDLIASREAAGIPYGVSVANQLKKDFLYLRKEPKGYTTNSVIEGVYKNNQTVVIVDDAISRGGDKKEIVKVLEGVGLKVKGVVVILDAFYGSKYRKPQQWLRENKKYKFVALTTWPELMKYAAESNFISKELSELIIKQIDDPFAWQKNPANWKNFKKIAIKEKNLIFDKSFDKI
ncbi:hypothetical protein KKB10_05300 [Patescibacteria group bacterium]|nr:hypothetical protein [Patescibacteria group bacterium]MBU1075386.1 hypothetical protein [Patescibacteria group bacterium]MBU1952319.1 hypothetical protein [Patescibacteria group bacterium]MBU2236261.1 hypothetical protein [Patescibacteria group bacterium]